MTLDSRLPQVARDLPAAVDAALAAGAQLVVNAARERVPYRTGRLHDAIHTTKTEDGVEVIAGSKEVFYGHLVEHGARGGTMPAHPFLLPSLEDNRHEILELTRKAIAEAAAK